MFAHIFITSLADCMPWIWILIMMLNLNTNYPSWTVIVTRQRWNFRHSMRRSQCVSSMRRHSFIFIWLGTFMSNFTTLHSTQMTIDGRTILAFFTFYSVAVFSLNLSWNLTTADVSSEMIHVLEIMTVLLHAIFFLCSFFMWVFVCLCRSAVSWLHWDSLFSHVGHTRTTQLERSQPPIIFWCGHLYHSPFCGLAL